MRGMIGAGLMVSVLIATVGIPAVAEDVRLRPLTPVYVDKEGTPILRPEGIACGRSSDVVVADTGNGRLIRYSVSEEAISAVATMASAQIPHPIHVQIAWDGTILALDGKSKSIGRFSPEGEFQGPLEPSGVTGKIVARSFTFGPDEKLYILDIFSDRVLVVDEAGAVTRQIAFPEEFGALADLAVDRGGRVFAIDSVGKRLYSAERGASVLTAVHHDLVGKADFPTSLAVDAAGNVYVGDQNGGSILVVGPDGSFRSRHSKIGWKTGLLRYPTKLCLDDKDHLFVADRANDRIQVFGILR
jgi:sugar lactone lactonase YvrE